MWKFIELEIASSIIWHARQFQHNEWTSMRSKQKIIKKNGRQKTHLRARRMIDGDLTKKVRVIGDVCELMTKLKSCALHKKIL